jgi:hypothetical protein
MRRERLQWLVSLPLELKTADAGFIMDGEKALHP